MQGKFGDINALSEHDQQVAWLLSSILITVLMVGICALFVWALFNSLDRQAIARCETLQEQSQRYKGFYVTESEHLMCSDVGYDLSSYLK